MIAGPLEFAIDPRPDVIYTIGSFLPVRMMDA
jgi:hypothetical protein